MSRQGAYIPLHEYPTPSLAHSRLFTSEFADRRPPLVSRIPRPSPRSIAVSVIAGVLLLILLRPREKLSWLQEALEGEGIDYRLGFTQLYSASTGGWSAYEPPAGTINEGETSGWKTWVDKLDDECVERLIARGEPCRNWPQGGTAVDAVWTYANGSDPLLRVWRAEVTAMLSGDVSRGVAQVRAAKRSRHFRDHDELRHSIRSALSSFSEGSLAKLHLLTPDIPSNTLLRDTIDPTPLSLDRPDQEGREPPLVTSGRIGQIPTWLAPRAGSAQPPLLISHHSSFFNNDSHLPTFNSLSIESQFPFLSLVDAEFLLYLNDDTFLLGRDSLVSTDVGSPLLGPVFRLQTDLTVGSTSPDAQVLNPEGEWASLERANWLLDQRFGARERNYLAHIPKAMSMPILREVGEIWRAELERTASSRFRGRQVEYQLPFLATHYVIESHRQALLLAFIVARTDQDGDRGLNMEERRKMLTELGFEDDEGNYRAESEVTAPFRSTKDRLPSLLLKAGLEHPRSTKISCSSMDGYCPFRGEETQRSKPVRPVRYLPDSTENLPEPYCRINLSKCFGSDFLELPTLSTLEVLRRTAFDHPDCGDCMIVHLVSKSGSSGLSSFLPELNDEPHSSSPPSPISPPFNLRPARDKFPPKTFDSFVLPHLPSSSFDRRMEVAREILQYSYVLGDSKSKFKGMRTPRDTERVLKDVTDGETDEDQGLVFLTLNDDFVNDHVSDMSQPILEAFYNKTWPDPSPYEA